MKRALTVLLLCAMASATKPQVLGIGRWVNWEFGTTVHLTHPNHAGSILVVKGISDSGCMQAVVDDEGRDFASTYQHTSPDGQLCEERWCKQEYEAIDWVQVFGSEIGPKESHMVSVTEETNGKCPF